NAMGMFYGLDAGGDVVSCVMPVTAPSESGSAAPSVGACTPFPYRPQDIVVRGGLVETLIERDSRFSLLEYRHDGTPVGPLVDVVVRSVTDGGAQLGFAGNDGLVVYQDEPVAGTTALRAQRIGCE